ncbi:D-alanyl-D-alanine carboxypeptidase/D-alanyl-D-alanine-endopeptidase [Ornithinimicrobium sp. Y1694]|uniref:D-alanyl-D-alanine carboxypeptidase/D-alanyl-D-alanine-endopeptidase n=1 Tax=Ornithinimicrobium sp. Y1694 TaxID=3418590 RepID=UPI003CEA0C3B
MRATPYAVLPASLLAIVLAWSPVASGAVAGGVDDASVTSTAAPETTSSPGTTSGPETTSAPTSAPEPTTPAEVRPRIAPLSSPLGQISEGVLPERGAVSMAISEELSSRWLGPSGRRAVTIRDALTGASLADRNADLLVVPASTTKILSTAAVVSALDPEHTFTTRVVSGPEPDMVVLVAGGDMMLARGAGDPEAVVGRVGLADLAAQTAQALADRGSEEPIRVSVDLSHVPGPTVLDSWTEGWVSHGYTGRIVQLGLAEDLALPFAPSPANPAQEAAKAFREALEDAGVDVAGDSDADVPEIELGDVAASSGGSEDAAASDDAASSSASEDATTTDAPTVDGPGTELAAGESAPVRDVLAHALATSDNAMVEQLVRQAADAAGLPTDRASVTDWIRQVAQEDYGVDVTGMRIADASGLSDGTRIPVAAVADVLVAGANGSHPELQEVLAAGGLPIAGYTGTLSTRFHLPVHAPAIGNARAKTGSLPNVTSLAGTVVTRDGRLLVFAMTADRIGEDGAVLEARSVLDEVVAELARCGC